jgi:hypothetical protein
MANPTHFGLHSLAAARNARACEGALALRI